MPKAGLLGSSTCFFWYVILGIGRPKAAFSCSPPVIWLALANFLLCVGISNAPGHLKCPLAGWVMRHCDPRALHVSIDSQQARPSSSRPKSPLTCSSWEILRLRPPRNYSARSGFFPPSCLVARPLPPAGQQPFERQQPRSTHSTANPNPALTPKLFHGVCFIVQTQRSTPAFQSTRSATPPC